MYLGVDVGGTTTKYVILDTDHQIVRSFSKETHYIGRAFKEKLTEQLDKILIEFPKIKKIGIGIPGVIDIHDDCIIDSPALEIKRIGLVRDLTDRYKCEVAMDNDVNAWTQAEYHFGAAKGLENFVMITIGTGIGAGIFINGKIYRGKNYSAGEIGYFPLGIDAYDTSKNENEFGYFEAIASAYGIRKTYENKKYGRSSRYDTQIETKDVFSLASQGDELSKRVVEEALDYIGLGLSQIVCLLQPEKIVIGGGLSMEGESLRRAITERVEKLIPFKTEIVISNLSAYGGALGAAFI